MLSIPLKRMTRAKRLVRPEDALRPTTLAPVTSPQSRFWSLILSRTWDWRHLRFGSTKSRSWSVPASRLPPSTDQKPEHLRPTRCSLSRRQCSPVGLTADLTGTSETYMAHEINRACIEACNACADACDHCATACLKEQDVKMMARCVALDMDCAAICRLASGYMSRGSDFAKQLCELCAQVCQACGDECGKHQHDHCRRCAEACRRCAEECRRMAA